MANFFPCCPNCSKTLPLCRTQWNLGQPFACEGCGTRLVIDKSYWLPLAGLIAFFAARAATGDGWHLLAVFLGIALAIFAAQMRTTRPEIVTTPAE